MLEVVKLFPFSRLFFSIWCALEMLKTGKENQQYSWRACCEQSYW